MNKEFVIGSTFFNKSCTFVDLDMYFNYFLSTNFSSVLILYDLRRKAISVHSSAVMLYAVRLLFNHLFKSNLAFIFKPNFGVSGKASCIRTLTKTDCQHIARNAKIFNSTRQCKAVRRNNALRTFKVNKALIVKVLGIDDCAVDVGEDLELIGASNVIAVAACTVADDATCFILTNLSRRERLNHAVCFSHVFDPSIVFDRHVFSLFKIKGSLSKR